MRRKAASGAGARFCASRGPSAADLFLAGFRPEFDQRGRCWPLSCARMHARGGLRAQAHPQPPARAHARTRARLGIEGLEGGLAFQELAHRPRQLLLLPTAPLQHLPPHPARRRGQSPTGAHGQNGRGGRGGVKGAVPWPGSAGRARRRRAALRAGRRAGACARAPRGVPPGPPRPVAPGPHAPRRGRPPAPPPRAAAPQRAARGERAGHMSKELRRGRLRMGMGGTCTSSSPTGPCC